MKQQPPLLAENGRRRSNAAVRFLFMDDLFHILPEFPPVAKNSAPATGSENHPKYDDSLAPEQ
jgi:hypothetical protein